MKNLFFFLLLSATFALVGCSDDDDDTPADFLTATVDGNAFEATSLTRIADNSFGEELVLINGTQTSNSQAIGLNIATSLGTGSNAVAADDFAITFTDDLSGTNAFFTEGTLNITRNDTTENVLEGTFNFTATNDVDPTNVFNVTDGEFKINY